MKIQKQIVTKDLSFSIDIQSLTPRTHSICDTYPNILDDLIREGLSLMELRLKALETIINHSESAARSVEDNNKEI